MSMNELDKYKEEDITVAYEINGNKIRLTPKNVQDWIVGTNAKITPQEYKMFTELCKVRLLNPFLKEAYLIKYSEKQPASMVVSKDAILKRAVLHPKFNGMKSGIIVITENGEEKQRQGTFKLQSEILCGGWAEIFRKDWENSIFSSVSLEECKQTKSNGEANSNWTKQPATMINKVAKVRALREAFVEDLSGLYEEEEIFTPQKEFAETEIIEQKDITENGAVEDMKEITFNDL